MSRWNNTKRGWREIGTKRIFFDSKAEANYYRYLLYLKNKKLIQDFEYHPPTLDFSEWIKHGTTRYELDFKITDINGVDKWIEIKPTTDVSKMDSSSRTRIKRMRKYYPDLALEIVSTKEINNLNVGLDIEGWE